MDQLTTYQLRMRKIKKKRTEQQVSTDCSTDQRLTVTPALETKMRQLANYLIDRILQEHEQKQLRKKHRLLSDDRVES